MLEISLLRLNYLDFLNADLNDNLYFRIEGRTTSAEVAQQKKSQRSMKNSVTA